MADMGENGGDAVMLLESEDVQRKKDKGYEGLMKLVHWEKFLPKMMLRVLLVEADDSTRQIITALLRKCSYRVAAVADGLMAWETVKGRPQSIDLILTELDLPSISGFALLTLVMSDDACKNIPVIMMSPHDSIGMAWKCILKGAADFLVKPVRKNELKNLWHHVWRRHALLGEGFKPASQPNIEATAENNQRADQGNMEYAENGSDTLSSCLGRCKQAEDADEQHMLGFSRPNCRNAETTNLIPCMYGGEARSDHDSSAPRRDPEEVSASPLRMEKTREAVEWNDTSNTNSSFGKSTTCSDEVEACDGAMDLISAFDEPPKGRYQFSGLYDDSAPELELSLNRRSPSSSGSLQIERDKGGGKLLSSNLSAFSRYDGKVFHSFRLADARNAKESLERTSGAQEQLSFEANTYFDQQLENITSCVSGQSEVPFQGPQPSTMMKSHDEKPVFFSRHGVSSRGGFSDHAHHRETCAHESNYGYPIQGQRSSEESVGGLLNKSSYKRDDDDTKAYSPTGGESTCTNDNGDHCAHGDNDSSKVESEEFIGAAPHYSSHREVALAKFRMKRKDRCFEKKVRYQSRRKLAEQRPRVKGQFVRVPPDEASAGIQESS